MNPPTFLIAAAILAALGAGWVSWMLFGIAVVVALIWRGVTTALLAERPPQ